MTGPPAPLAATLRARIAAAGPLRLDAWMAACNRAYYGTRDPLGRDFVTAPEISQMFGEMVGGWIGDLWLRAGSPRVRLVELGPGRGTLMADARRVLARLPGLAMMPLALIETSPVLRRAQAERLPPPADPDWYDDLAAVPTDLPVIVIANEFFDALPIRQQDAAGTDRHVVATASGFAGEPMAVARELSPAGEALAAAIGARLRAQGGAALIIDYGNWGTGGDTLQAISGHAAADPFADPGVHDLTAHVDFAALAAAASGVTLGAVRTAGPVPQGVWLARLGIEARAAALQAGAAPRAAAETAAALVRLTAPAAMGSLFKVMALTAANWPAPAGFDG